MGIKRIIIAITLLIATAAHAQTHVPSYTLTGRILTCDAETAWVFPTPNNPTNPGPVVIRSGIVITGSNNVLVGTPTSPISWELQPGEYALNMLGFPDSATSTRNKVGDQVITVVSNFDDDVREAYIWAVFWMAKVRSLNPTYDDIVRALDL